MRKILLLLFAFPSFLFAQKTFQVNNIAVLRNGSPLQNPWAGGLNNPVISPMDLNQDNLADLIIYDKAGWKALAFLNTGSPGHPSYTYAPQYDRMFPRELRDWAVMRDYNGDGVGDIFAVNSNSGIEVFKGYRATDGFLSFVQVYSALTYPFGFNVFGIWTFQDNMPVLMDIDGDGDLDVLASTIGGGTTLNYYQNMAVDSGYNKDSLVFQLGSSCWGHFQEDVLDCGVGLGMCKKELDIPAAPASGTPRHQGGACCGFHYRPHSNTVSLLLADVYCNTLKFLENTGDSLNADVTSYDTIFPNYDLSVNLPLFPCAYEADANNDGYKDLFVAPFASNSTIEGQSEDINVIKYYQNIGSDTVSNYHYAGDTLINNGIVDVGTESHPVFFDYNSDGLMDIVMGNYGQFELSGFPKSDLALYQNIGSDTMPIYKEMSLDWNRLSQFQLHGIYPAFGDLDGDGHPDMVIGDAYGYVSFFHNAGGDTAAYPAMTQSDWFGLNVLSNAAPCIYDVNGDGLNDLVIGSRANNISYYWNFGTPDTPKFSQDSVNNFFGHVKVYNTHIGSGVVPGYATPFITRENGSMLLYSGSQQAATFKFIINPDSLRSGSFAVADTDVLGINPGQRSTISVADINHDGHNDYLAGSIRGGMTIYSEVNWGHEIFISGISEVAVSGELAIFPNPARDKLTCRMTNAAATLTSARLYNLMGEMINIPSIKQDETSIILSVNDVADGIYLVEVKDARGHTFQKKVAILK